MDPKIVFVVAVCGFTLAAAISDFRFKGIPKWLVVPALFAAFAFHTLTGGWWGLLGSLAGFATGFSILLVLWLIGGSGAGDVKLMGALGAWLGWEYTLYVYFASTLFVIAGTVVVLCAQAMRHGTGYVRQRYVAPVKRNKKKKVTEENYMKWRQRRRVMPYGLPVALGTWVVLAMFWNGLLVH